MEMQGTQHYLLLCLALLLGCSGALDEVANRTTGDKSANSGSKRGDERGEGVPGYLTGVEDIDVVTKSTKADGTKLLSVRAPAGTVWFYAQAGGEVQIYHTTLSAIDNIDFSKNDTSLLAVKNVASQTVTADGSFETEIEISDYKGTGFALIITTAKSNNGIIRLAEPDKAETYFAVSTVSRYDSPGFEYDVTAVDDNLDDLSLHFMDTRAGSLIRYFDSHLNTLLDSAMSKYRTGNGSCYGGGNLHDNAKLLNLGCVNEADKLGVSDLISKELAGDPDVKYSAAIWFDQDNDDERYSDGNPYAYYVISVAVCKRSTYYYYRYDKIADEATENIYPDMSQALKDEHCAE